jgi:hypothetical protein
MTTMTLVNATTAAAGSPSAPIPFNTDNYESIGLSASGLAAAEEVDVYVSANEAWVLATAPNGTVVKLTATAPHAQLTPGPRYGVAKDATAGACSVNLHLGTKP